MLLVAKEARIKNSRSGWRRGMDGEQLPKINFVFTGKIAYWKMLDFLNGPLGWRLLRNRGRTRAFASRIFAKCYHQRLQKFIEGDWKPPVAQYSSGGVVVSLTSWKPRLGTLPLVLFGLLEQSLRPDKIFVWLTAEDLAMVDGSLKERFQAEGVEFRSCDNFGPHKKWLPLVREGWEESFVICDDDIFYPENWLGSLVAEDRAEAYVGTRVHRLCLVDTELAGYESWSRDIAWNGEASHSNFITGCGGAVVHPGRIGRAFRDWDRIQALCPKADDIWLKAAHLDAGVPVYKTEFSFPCLEIPGSEDSGLLRHNVDACGNDAQLQILREVLRRQEA